MELAQIPVERFQCDECVAKVDRGVAQILNPATVRVVEDFGKCGERERKTRGTLLFGVRDHVNRQPLVDAVRGTPATPWHVEADVASAPGRRIPVETLHPAVLVTGDDQLDTGMTALQ